ncbi:GAF and ANTAR domain-containing protein [Modestobacter sp. KNN46-3]|jgi:GAF domain-containing protein|uniref:GAF and ANTAR domain-containing protein n=1 Tax=Modestobacter sp. KNN46-3 TaxID=2711218 RepID=UPI0013DEF27F|nr:GAF and ANTAR domain-containing protein [Modestobacter sp. KNN46-3]
MSGRSDESQGRGRPSAQDTGTSENSEDLARRLADAARELQDQSDSQQVMDQVVAMAVAMVPGAECAGISIGRKRRSVTSAAATSDRPRQFDALQDETGQGPCVDALYEQQTVRSDDVPNDERWPDLAARAADIGVASMLCLQLFVEGDNLGALNLFSDRTGTFTDESEQVGLLLAAHASVAVAQAQKIEHVNVALANRDVIGQAKGILMERFKITADQAFNLLAKVSQDTNRKVHQVAQDLTLTGQLSS